MTEIRLAPDRTLLRIGAWSGLAFIVLFGIGWGPLLAGFLPPIAPGRGAADVAAYYADHQWALRVGAVAIMVSAVTLLPLGALLFLLVVRVERGLGMLSLMLGFSVAALMVETFYVGLSFDVAAFRADRPAELVRAFDDFGMLQAIGGTPLFLGIFCVLAYAIVITQRRGPAVFPRWFGYVNLLFVVAYLPEVLVFLLRTGPFAWNGVVGFWVPAVVLVVYLVGSPYVLLGAVRRAFP